MMDQAALVPSQISRTIELPPSCIQFCRRHGNFCVVGTYNLQRAEELVEGDGEETSVSKPPQSRNGTLLVFKLEGAEFAHVQTLSQPSAILDLRFHPDPEWQDILAVVSSTGSLAVFKLDPNVDPISPLKHVATSRCNDLGEDVLFLQCSWHPVVRNLIGVTTSTGEARLLQLDDEYRIAEPAFELDIPNSLEAWSIAFSPASTALEAHKTQVTAYCGGDDSMLRYSTCVWNGADLEAPYEAPFPPMTIKNIHAAGVTAILPLPLLGRNNGRLVVTGSYDDHLRVLLVHDLHETFGLRRVELVLEENLGGGVWRLDPVSMRQDGPRSKLRILASCMHAGARLLDISSEDGETWVCKVLARFEEHRSMNYGSDFVTPTDDGKVRVISTSFYDKLVCVWEYDAGSE